MDTRLRRVTQLPVTELWDDSGTRIGRIVRADLTGDDIRELLRLGAVQFVEVAMSERPCWIPMDQRFEFWKDQLQPRLTQWGPDGRIYTDEFPVYVASQWEVEGGQRARRRRHSVPLASAGQCSGNDRRDHPLRLPAQDRKSGYSRTAT